MRELEHGRELNPLLILGPLMRLRSLLPTLAVVLGLSVSPLSLELAHADDAGIVADAPEVATSPDAGAAPAPSDAGTIDASSPVVAQPAAAEPAPELPDTMTAAQNLWRGITEKNWFLVAGAALSLLIAGALALLKKKWPTFEKDRWGYILAAGMSGVTALAIAWSADAPVASDTTLMGALRLFAAAVFAFVTAKKLPSSS